MKTRTSVIGLCLFIFAPFALADLEGLWNTGKENTIITIHQEDGNMLGEIVSSDNPKAKPGTNLIKDLKKDGEVWKGRLFAPKKRKWVDATFTRQGDNLNVLVKVGFSSNSVDWKLVRP